mgnify:CR=1 FL=1
MNTSTTQAYEACIQNASVKISNSEWVNEYKQGIKIERGDSIRLLGSFVNEQSNGEEIEITDDMVVNVEFSPFIKGQTFFTADKTTELASLSKLGDIPYSTDSFGIEPPGFWYDDGQATTASPANIQLATWNNDCSLDDLYSDVHMTGTSGLHYGTGGSQWYSQNNEAVTWGTNIKTYDNTGKNTFVEHTPPPVPLPENWTKINDRKIYEDWANFSCRNELYVSELVKKLILPVMTSIDTQDCYGGVPLSTIEPLNENPPAAGYGCLSGIPKPGMLISTIDIGYATGFYDDDGNSYFQADGHIHGQPNLMNGPQSVIGEILAVRPIKKNFRGHHCDCFEIYVHNWVNPGVYRTRNIRRTGLTSAHFRKNKSATRELASTFTGNPTIDLEVQIHGAGELENGYNTNSSSNNINGPYSQGKTCLQADTPNNNNQLLSGSPDEYTFNSTLAVGPPAYPHVGSNDTFFKESCLNNNISEYQYGFSKAQGLSFLWNGSYGSQYRYNDIGLDSPSFYPTRAISQIIYNTQTNQARMLYKDNFVQANQNDGNPQASPHCLNPAMFGAFVICSKETMIDIVNGVYTNIDDGRVDGYQSRIWFDYSVQIGQSGYNERHYAGNSWTQTNFSTAPGHAGTNGYDSNYQSPIAGVPPRTEYRYDLEMMGKPQSQNWRARGHIGNLEPYADQGLWIGSQLFATATGRGPVCTSAPTYVGDGGGDIMSTATGDNDAQWIQTGLPGGPDFAHFGCPFQLATYETSVNSIHFQDKNTGDVNLGINQETGVANGDYFYYTSDNLILPSRPAGTPITITARDVTAPNTPLVDAYVWVNSNDGLSDFIVKITAVIVLSPIQFTIQLDKATGIGNIFAGAVFRISPTTSPSITGAGVTAIPWVSDLLILRPKTAKYYIPSGFYTEDQLANTINDRLHDTTLKYKTQFGDADGNVPTNVGKKEQQNCSQNTAVRGNFIHTYIPDLNYGFTPVTTDNETALDLTASTKDMTTQLITYETLPDGFGTGFIFYHEGEFPAYNGTTARYVTDDDSDYPTLVGKKTKLYSIPYLNNRNGELHPQVHLIRLRGGALNKKDVDTDAGPPITFKGWNLAAPRFSGFYEGLRDLRTHYTGINGATDHGTAFSSVWRTRLNRNLLLNGGSAKLFVGANNLTLSFVEQVNKFSLNNLYTPLRPSLSENSAKTDFSIDDAIPSAIIGAELTGTIEDMLSGIYINKLVGDAFTQTNFGTNWFNNELFDTDPQSLITSKGTDFWTTMGYTETQLDTYNNNFTTQPIFIFAGKENISGLALRVGSKITPAVNGTNPFANSCLLINPVQQYFVEVDSDDFFAQNSATKGTDPYYYIGSDFPTKQFFGNDTGEKLPVIGICARNFHSFNFAFDLGASSISYTCDQDVTITSIKTAIYRNNLKAPTNLSKYSSVIYLLTKANYYNPLPQQDALLKSQIIEQNYMAPYAPYFYNPAPYQYRSEPPPIIPKDYYIDEGVPPLPEDTGDDDDDTDEDE